MAWNIEIAIQKNIVTVEYFNSTMAYNKSARIARTKCLLFAKKRRTTLGARVKRSRKDKADKDKCDTGKCKNQITY